MKPKKVEKKIEPVEITKYIVKKNGIIVKVFDTKEEAEQKSAMLKEEYNVRTYNQNKNKKDVVLRSSSWELGYHKREINKLNKTLAYHNSKIKFYKEG